jgi:DNA-binding helix-turn-helix protein
MEFNEKLQELRKEKGMSQEALAYELGVSRQAVSKWETAQGYPEMDKLIQIGKLFHVSMDYLLNNENVVQNTESENEGNASYVYTMEMIESTLRWKKRFAFFIAFGVAFIVGALSFPILMRNSDMGGAVFLLAVAISAAIFIASGLMDHHLCEHLDERIYVKQSDIDQLHEQYRRFRMKFTLMITLGVFLCIIGLCVVVLMDALYTQYSDKNGVWFVLFVAVALLLIIPAGIIDSSYQRFVYFDKHNKNKEKEQKKIKEAEEGKTAKYDFLWGITMPLTAFFFIWQGLEYDNWKIMWIVFPVMAIITTGFINILNLLDKNKQDK